MTEVKNSDAISNEPPNQPAALPKSSREIPFWRQMLAYFLLVFFGILCIHAVSRLHEIGEPIYGMACEAFFVALIITVVFGITDGARTNKQ